MIDLRQDVKRTWRVRQALAAVAGYHRAVDRLEWSLIHLMAKPDGDKPKPEPPKPPPDPGPHRNGRPYPVPPEPEPKK
jgi:hypothetical protein